MQSFCCMTVPFSDCLSREDSSSSINPTRETPVCFELGINAGLGEMVDLIGLESTILFFVLFCEKLVRGKTQHHFRYSWFLLRSSEIINFWWINALADSLSISNSSSQEELSLMYLQSFITLFLFGYQNWWSISSFVVTMVSFYFQLTPYLTYILILQAIAFACALLLVHVLMQPKWIFAFLQLRNFFSWIKKG